MMRRFILCLVVSFSVIINLFAGENLVENPGFESGRDVGYEYYSLKGSVVDYSLTNLNATEGDSALFVDITTVPAGGPQIIRVQQRIDASLIDQSKPYMFSFNLTASKTGLRFRVRVKGATNEDIVLTTLSGTNRYEHPVQNMPVPTGNNEYELSIQFGYESENNATAFYIDELSFTDVNDPNPGPGAGNVFVSPTGLDTNTGTMDSPVKTLSKAFELLDGDTIYMMEGTYHDYLQINSELRTSSNPLVICAYNNAEVFFDGTESISDNWVQHQGSIYKTAVGKEMWQLFKGDTMYMPARWPNAFLHDGSVWERELAWAHGNTSKSENGYETNDESHANDLTTIDSSLIGAYAVLNIGSWKTWARKITHHTANTDSFRYEPVAGGYKDKHHYYYVEGKLHLLDAPGEWFFDTITNEVYVWSFNNGNPGAGFKGKTQSYAFEINNSSNIQIRGINFFGTTVRALGSSNITIEDCDFDFASCSKRVLGISDIPDATVLMGSTSKPSLNKIINSSFTNLESHAIYMEGMNDTVSNCYFNNIDWIVADRPALMNSIYVLGNNNVFRRNTIHQCGASSTIKPGNFPIIEYNRVWSTGYCQSDGSITQITIDGAPDSQTRYNWFHNTIKSGARFDAPIPPTRWGNSGLMHHNVTWGTNQGLMIKGERHFVFNNTGFSSNKIDIVVLDDSKDGGGANVGTKTINNFAEKISGNRSNFEPIPGIVSNNWNGFETGTDYSLELVDPGNLDFRPKKGSEIINGGTDFEEFEGRIIDNTPDIGAYEFGDTLYWIAGRQVEQASTPIPGNGNSTNNTNIDLMWLEGYQAIAHHVYFGTSYDEVQNASINSDAHKGLYFNNIFHPDEMAGGTVYYWRVDAVLSDGSVVKGTVWNFTPNNNSNLPETPTHEVRVVVKENDLLLNGAEVSFNGELKISDQNGEVLFSSISAGGPYELIITMIDYEDFTDNVTISNDTVITVQMQAEIIHNQVTFLIKEDDLSVEGATVEFNLQVKTSGQDGSVVFDSVPHGEEYVVNVSHSNYQDYTETFGIASDSIFIVQLTPKVSGLPKVKKNNYTVTPNPFEDIIAISNLNSGNVIEVLNLTGANVFTQETDGNKEYLDLGHLRSGIYLLKISSKEFGSVSVLKIIKK